ncbi:MAG: response regulator [Gemmatimonas sp.]
MFVDDDRQIVGALGNLLRRRRANWHVRFASSATEAIEELEKELADVIVTDLRMPETDGQQLLRTVQLRWPNIVRVILSGEIDLDISSLGGQAHVLLTKPVDSQELLTTLDRIGTALDHPIAK